MVAPGSAGRPKVRLFLGAGSVVIGGERVETTAGELELERSLGDRYRSLPETFEHMANESRRVAMAELLILFKDGEYTTAVPPRPAYSSAIATLGLLIGWAWGQENTPHLQEFVLLC